MEPEHTSTAPLGGGLYQFVGIVIFIIAAREGCHKVEKEHSDIVAELNRGARLAHESPKTIAEALGRDVTDYMETTPKVQHCAAASEQQLAGPCKDLAKVCRFRSDKPMIIGLCSEMGNPQHRRISSSRRGSPVDEKFRAVISAGVAGVLWPIYLFNKCTDS